MHPEFSIRSYARFEDLPLELTQFFEQGSGHSFYYGLPWFKNFATHGLDEGDRIRIYVAESGDGLRQPLAAIVTRYNARVRGILRPHRLVSLSNFYTARFGPIWSDSERRGQGILALARGIVAERPRWDSVDLRPLDKTSPAFLELVDSLKKAGLIVQTYSCFGDWYLPVNGRSYREYFEGLSAPLKNTITRKSKKLRSTGQCRMEIVTGGKGLDEAIAAYEKVYGASWKRPEPYPLFTAGLIRTCAENGWLRLGLLYVGEEPAAAQFWIVQNGVASIYKLAYDEKFAGLSAGTVLAAQMMEHVLDVDHVHEVDYLHGDEPYKKEWMSHRRERWGIVAVNPRTLFGSLALIRNVGGRAAKQAMLKLLGRPAGVHTTPETA
jgi:hypothetical protein